MLLHFKDENTKTKVSHYKNINDFSKKDTLQTNNHYHVNILSQHLTMFSYQKRNYECIKI